MTELGSFADFVKKPEPVVPDVKEFLGEVETTRGVVEVFETSDPFVPERMFALVAVLHGLPVMFVTYNPGQDETKWVHLVWRDADSVAYQSERDGEVSFPVQFGKWLFDHGHLTHHSADRTDAGERWAQAVGGCVPERLPVKDDPENPTAGPPYRTAPKVVERQALRTHAKLREVDWKQARVEFATGGSSGEERS